MTHRSLAGHVNAPNFPSGLDWLDCLNWDRPLNLRDQRSKIVILNFWTHC